MLGNIHIFYCSYRPSRGSRKSTLKFHFISFSILNIFNFYQTKSAGVISNNVLQDSGWQRTQNISVRSGPEKPGPQCGRVPRCSGLRISVALLNCSRLFNSGVDQQHVQIADQLLPSGKEAHQTQQLTSRFSISFCSLIRNRISFIFVSSTIPPITNSFKM